jgi:hypothetical protein
MITSRSVGGCYTFGHHSRNNLTTMSGNHRRRRRRWMKHSSYFVALEREVISEEECL